MSSAPSPIIRHVSRRELTQNRFVWLATGLMYALIAVVTIGITMTQSGMHPHRLQAMTALVIVGAIWHLRTEPPAMDTLRNHVVIAGAWFSTALGLWVCQPGGSIAIAAALFIGPLAAVRLDDRRQIAAHIVAYAITATVIGYFGRVDASTAIAITLVMLGSSVLAFSCAVILEAAEAQGDELERLVRRDPLTGVGNRRLLDERLADEIVRHERTSRHLAVIALDLNGFKILNDTVGHAAGDDLLRDVAEALSSVVDPRDTVVRQGGDEFCLVLPETTAVHAERTANAIRARLAQIESYGANVTTGIGIATYPTDALRGDVLLHVADERLRANKPPRELPDPFRLASVDDARHGHG